MSGPLRIAFYGYAEPDAGSISSAGYVLLREMLGRGHRIDFFGKRCFAFPNGLDGRENFRFINTEERVERLLGRVAAHRPTRLPAGVLLSWQTRRNVRRAMRREHGQRAYDVCYYHGIWPFGRTRGLRNVSWVQGAPGTDARSIARHAAMVRRHEGLARYVGLRAYASFRQTLGRPPFANADVVLCGSTWSARQLQSLVPASTQVHSVAYPIDLARFTPADVPRARGTPTILWAGRIVPRKRLDLFLGACERLIDAGRDVCVRVVGGVGFAPGLLRRLDTFAHRDRLEYAPGVPRHEMPAVYRDAAVLVQPSEDEDFGSSVAEAMACGTPVVVGPTNGTADYVGDGGERFDAYSEQSVAAAIARVLDGDADTSRRRARTAAEAAFGVRVVVDRVESILQQTAGKAQ